MPDLSTLAEGFPAAHGPLGLLSSDEFTPPARAFDEALGVGSGSTIGLILDADHRAAPHSARLARAHFARLGAETVELDMHGSEPFPDYDIAYIGGGSPAALLRCLRESPRWNDVMERWKLGAALAGSSAGAMVLSEHCLTPNEGDRVPTRWSPGLGPIRTAGFAVHASSRARAWLDDVARDAPVPVLALDDATGVILRVGKPVITAGPGRVWFVTETG